MDAILKIATEDAGMTQQQGETATGGIFALVKKNLESGQYNQIISKFPEIDSLVKKEEAATSERVSGSGGGSFASSLSALAGAAGGSGGGNAGGIASLLATLSKQGISAKQVNAFLPQVATLVQQQCGVDIGSILGVSSTSSGTSAGGAQTGAAGDSSAMSGALNSAMGMFGKK